MIRFVVVVVALAFAIQWTVSWSGWLDTTPSQSVVINISIATLTLGLGLYLGSIDVQQKFVQLYLLSIVVKIFLGCLLVAIVILVDRSSAKLNVIFFLGCYLFYTTAEITYLFLVTRSRRS